MNRLILAKIITFVLILAFSFALTFNNEAKALIESDKYVRTANYFLKAGTDLKTSDYEKLAKFDLLILPQEAQVYNKDFFTYAKKHNPDIVILAYTPTRSINFKHLNDSAGLRRDLIQGANDNWYLYDSYGGVISTWPDTQSFNATTDWNEYLPLFVRDRILSTGLWDGVFYDEVDSAISFVNNGNVDLDKNGRRDAAWWADQKWRQGVEKLLSNTRSLIDDKQIIVINGSSYDAYQPYVNGRMFESFPTPWEGNGTWGEVMANYLHLPKEVGYDPVFIINGNTNNTGNKNNYQKVRFGLTSALLGNGYFGFDFGDKNHGQIWQYDEYGVFLGAPTSQAERVDDGLSQMSPGLWRRDFKEGIILVNSSGEYKELRFKEEFEKIHGTQDPQVNNGSVVSRAKLAPQDGLILLRPIEIVKEASFTNASFARIFNKNGEVSRSGFFAYDSRFKGNDNMIIKDVDLDGEEEILIAGDKTVSIYNKQGRKETEFFPYGQNYDKGVNIDIGDLNNDGNLEIVTGTRNGGGPQIRIFNAQGKLINPGFFAYDSGFRGGVNIAVGDLNGDGWNEIIAGAGVGGGPHIRVFNKDGKVINPGFFAYEPGFRGGVNVAVGDLNGDAIDEIVAGPGLGGGPQVRIFNKEGNILSQGFFAYNKDARGGVKVAVSDLNGDGQAEILALTTDVFTLSSLMYNEFIQ